MTRAAGPIKLVIIGATGRMGTSLLRLLPQFPRLQLHAAVAAPGHCSLGRDSGERAGLAPNGVKITAGLVAALQGAGLAIDFSVAASSAVEVDACAAAGVPLLLGTTGLGVEMPAVLERAAQRIPLLVTANTSLGVTVLLDLVRRAATALGDRFDVQIQDTHHRDKVDSPSGTALALGEAALAGGTAPGMIGYASLRGGDVVGEHEIQFLGEGERLSLRHGATDRSVFARGALQAGCWLAGQPKGAYRMADLLAEK